VQYDFGIVFETLKQKYEQAKSSKGEQDEKSGKKVTPMDKLRKLSNQLSATYGIYSQRSEETRISLANLLNECMAYVCADPTGRQEFFKCAAEPFVSKLDRPAAKEVLERFKAHSEGIEVQDDDKNLADFVAFRKHLETVAEKGGVTRRPKKDTSKPKSLNESAAQKEPSKDDHDKDKPDEEPEQNKEGEGEEEEEEIQLQHKKKKKSGKAKEKEADEEKDEGEKDEGEKDEGEKDDDEKDEGEKDEGEKDEGEKDQKAEDEEESDEGDTEERGKSGVISATAPMANTAVKRKSAGTELDPPSKKAKKGSSDTSRDKGKRTRGDSESQSQGKSQSTNDDSEPEAPSSQRPKKRHKRT